MKRFAHTFRAALLGFMTLFVIGILIIAADSKKHRKQFYERAQERAIAAGEPLDLVAQDAELQAAFAKEQIGAVVVIGLVGAFFSIGLLLILRYLFPVGPTSKIVIGSVCGPFLPMLVFAPNQIANGKADDLNAVLLLGMIVGALIGLLEANRVIQLRREAKD